MRRCREQHSRRLPDQCVLRVADRVRRCRVDPDEAAVAGFDEADDAAVDDRILFADETLDAQLVPNAIGDIADQPDQCALATDGRCTAGDFDVDRLAVLA